ncbi:MAG: ATP-binding cassette domain-containing protein [Spirochaetaceae bacterium]
MLQLEDLHFAYPKKAPLFSGIDFSLRPGGIYGLLGKNGAGKTTLLKLSLGLLFPERGESRLFDGPAERRDPACLAEVAFVPENFAVPPVSVAEYIHLYGAYYPRFDQGLMERYLRAFELEETMRLPAVSYGQKKKLLLAFALATNARLVVLDEPTNGLDIPSKRVFRKVCAEAIDDARAFIISTHQVRDVQNLIDPIVILHNGKVLFNHSVEEIESALTLRRRDSAPSEALYSQKEMGAYLSLEAGGEGEEEIDLEFLFEAVMSNPAEIEETISVSGGVR